MIIQHNNTRAHSAKKTKQKIKDLGWEVLPHSPDIAPSDYHLFRSMQHFFSGMTFKNIDDIRIFLSKSFP
jgi:[histone H3]-lysine36 N-dimethyltransferase SETMAR